MQLHEAGFQIEDGCDWRYKILWFWLWSVSIIHSSVLSSYATCWLICIQHTVIYPRIYVSQKQLQSQTLKYTLYNYSEIVHMYRNTKLSCRAGSQYTNCGTVYLRFCQFSQAMLDSLFSSSLNSSPFSRSFFISSWLRLLKSPPPMTHGWHNTSMAVNLCWIFTTSSFSTRSFAAETVWKPCKFCCIAIQFLPRTIMGDNSCRTLV